jgi:hypothetical protein
MVSANANRGKVERVLSAGTIEEDDEKLWQALTNVGGKQSTFYRALGFEVLHGGEESSFSGLLNLIVQLAERRCSGGDA